MPATHSTTGVTRRSLVGEQMPDPRHPLLPYWEGPVVAGAAKAHSDCASSRSDDRPGDPAQERSGGCTCSC
jgi:hypothetical protein